MLFGSTAFTTSCDFSYFFADLEIPAVVGLTLPVGKNYSPELDLLWHVVLNEGADKLKEEII